MTTPLTCFLQGGRAPKEEEVRILGTCNIERVPLLSSRLVEGCDFDPMKGVCQELIGQVSLRLTGTIDIVSFSGGVVIVIRWRGLSGIDRSGVIPIGRYHV